MEMTEFLQKLSSKEPTPGGGGVSALVGALAAALCSMAANLTSGKKKYAAYQADIERILAQAGACVGRMYDYIEQDAQAFAPLSAAYGIPKDTPGCEETLERALQAACAVPFSILKESCAMLPMLEELEQKASRLVVSDVGVAAAACRCAIESAALNVYINTKLMRDRVRAAEIDGQTREMTRDGVTRCAAIVEQVTEALRA